MKTQARAISKAAGFMGAGASDRERMRDNRQAAEAARAQKAAEAVIVNTVAFIGDYMEAGRIILDTDEPLVMAFRMAGDIIPQAVVTPILDGTRIVGVKAEQGPGRCLLPETLTAFERVVWARLARNQAARAERAEAAEANKPETVKPCNPKPCNPETVKPYGGQPLTERAGASAVLSASAYAFEFTATSGADVYGCYDAATHEQKYALEVVGGLVTHCNCPDRLYRRRVCKHQIELAVALQTGLRTPGGSVVMAASALSMLQSGPRTVADSLRALREDYHAAAVRAVILTAAQVEAIQ